jgi:hypothetical protein
MVAAEMQVVTPIVTDTLEEWWLNTRSNLNKGTKKKLDTWVLLICWSIWKQRNARAFGNIDKQ